MSEDIFDVSNRVGLDVLTEEEERFEDDWPYTMLCGCCSCCGCSCDLEYDEDDN